MGRETMIGALIGGIIIGGIAGFFLGFCIAHWLDAEWGDSDDVRR